MSNNTPEAEQAKKLIKVCEQISNDVENDAKEFDGKPFNGKIVAEYFGNHGAAINALANVLKEVLERQAAQLQPVADNRIEKAIAKCDEEIEYSKSIQLTDFGEGHYRAYQEMKNYLNSLNISQPVDNGEPVEDKK